MNEAVSDGSSPHGQGRKSKKRRVEPIGPAISDPDLPTTSGSTPFTPSISSSSSSSTSSTDEFNSLFFDEPIPHLCQRPLQRVFELGCDRDPLKMLSVVSQFLVGRRWDWNTTDRDSTPTRVVPILKSVERARFQMPFLPRELCELILSHLSEPEHMRAALGVCATWRHIIKDTPHLWRVASGNLKLEDDTFVNRLVSSITSHDMFGARLALLCRYSLESFCGAGNVLSPFHLACSLGDIDSARAIMEECGPVDVNLCGQAVEGWFKKTPLSWCAFRANHLEMARYLLQHCHASPNKSDSFNTPLSYAVTPPSTLERAKMWTASEEHDARWDLKARQFIHLLVIDHHVNVNAIVEPSTGVTPIMNVCRFFDAEDKDAPDYVAEYERSAIEILRYLVSELGANVNAQCNNFGDGATTLIYATCAGLSEVVRVLLDELGADPTKKDDVGMCALDHARSQKGGMTTGTGSTGRRASCRTPSFHTTDGFEQREWRVQRTRDCVFLLNNAGSKWKVKSKSKPKTKVKMAKPKPIAKKGRGAAPPPPPPPQQ
eukprot:TRINITY_DN120_c0_g1_i1.p1 TRINITY_DN120_c0_g1~~TRINITY_DN120_c0_g1_i1.p1  ORF type:complete len:567 (+),score=80.57 TRINITY_DN120_c0_g1_i1:65-1702(+)